jgi:hypothetical protein
MNEDGLVNRNNIFYETLRISQEFKNYPLVSKSLLVIAPVLTPLALVISKEVGDSSLK